MAITMQMIQELRERTGIGMTKCKSALTESGGDIDKAIENLRKAGMASAVKKEGRATNEGMITSAESGDTVSIVEVNAETDFVVSNDRFKEFMGNLSCDAAASNPASLEAFLATPYSKESSLTIDQYRATMVQTIGENLQISRVKTFKKGSDNSVGVYSHLGGKIICVVEISGSSDEEELAKGIAMHIAAASPECVNPEDVSTEILEKEKEIVRIQLKGKPENIMDKIIEGKINAYFDDVCLTRQKYIRNDSVTIGQLVANKAKETGKPLKITSFTRWSVGQQ